MALLHSFILYDSASRRCHDVIPQKLFLNITQSKQNDTVIDNLKVNKSSSKSGSKSTNSNKSYSASS